MRYKPYLISILLWLVTTAAAAQTAPAVEEPRYRVELIVLMHLDHGEEARRLRWLEDYSAALDLLSPKPEAEGEAGTEGSTLGEDTGSAISQVPAADDPAMADTAQPEPAAADPAAADGQPPEEPEPDPLGGVVHVPELGPQMQDAWRRLRLSGPFRPLQYLAWEQRSSAPFPALRLHNGEAILVQDPWAEERAAEQAERDAATATAGEPPVATFGDAPTGLAPEGTAEEAGLPPPIQYFRLDGTAQLTRSRFLHLGLTIEWREPVFGELSADRPLQPEPPPGAPPPGATDVAAGLPTPDAFDVFRLEQSRQVRLRRMEYFDGPVLGVLAWISPVNETAGEEAEAMDEVEMARAE